ncbi:TPD1 protein homolog 1-like [Salvia splendens]|uniref:TPD1 protein homolog 1-like n=1 Tax=Salvia splendens TaxID=180675 RepID=UPI001C2616D9|nr:TPD1 protein homolog 1-like [Salvia splendens]
MRLAIAVFYILCFISTAFGKCGPNDIVVGTVRSGRVNRGLPEWDVQVVNNCNCSQSDIIVTCRGFQTVKPVDRSIFQTKGDYCLINRGRPIRPRADVRFTYAWDRPTFFFPYSTKSRC